MGWRAFPLILLIALAGPPARAGLLDRWLGPSDEKVASGLREALDVGTANAVASTGKLDGFLKNEAIRILLPEEIRKLEKGLRAVGLGSQLDAFEVSINRAAERASPQAKSIFKEAIRGITFADAKRILRGGDTAATEYFRGKTSDRLTAAFLPIVAASLDEVGSTRQYKALEAKIAKLPLVKGPQLDLDAYVTSRALDGLFHVLGEEERRIRKDPAARVTRLLKDVFGGSGR